MLSKEFSNILSGSMIKEYLVHLAHKAKFFLRDKSFFRGKGVILKLSEKIIGQPSHKMIIKTLYGFKMMIDPVNDNGVERAIYYTGTYEAGTLHVFDHLLKPGDVFFDIGSNIGLMAIFAAKKTGDTGVVHSFEPEPETFKILQQNCSLNHLRNIQLNNIALGSEEREGIIYPNMDINRGASSLVRQDNSAGKTVWISTLDQYLEKNKVHPIKLMKIDIEGYELEMLKGAAHLLRSTAAPILCVEYSEVVVHSGVVQDLYDFIISINQYRIFKLMKSKEDVGKLQEVFTKQEMPVHDNVFCFLPQHLSVVDPAIFN